MDGDDLFSMLFLSVWLYTIIYYQAWNWPVVAIMALLLANYAHARHIAYLASLKEKEEQPRDESPTLLEGLIHTQVIEANKKLEELGTQMNALQVERGFGGSR